MVDKAVGLAIGKTDLNTEGLVSALLGCWLSEWLPKPCVKKAKLPVKPYSLKSEKH
jgi:hypothetical protein